MRNLRLSTCFLLYCVIGIIFPTQCNANICLPKQHAALFIFGDSLFDPGNNNYIKATDEGHQENYWPYGVTFFKYPTGRFSDGRIIPDFIAEYAKLPLLQPYLHPGYHEYINGANFASGGAGALSETYQGLVIDIKTQLSYFENVNKLLKQKLGVAETKTLLSRAVYLFNIRGNNYEAIFITNPSMLQSYSADKYADMVIGNLTTVIKEIYKKGGRKFGFIGLSSLGCSPILKVLVKNGSTDACLEEVSALVKLHNSALSKALNKLEKQLRGFKYSLTNLYDITTDLINYPSKYGFKEGKVACCGTGPFKGFF
ncbi:GDSL esterase/lipase [Quillaja saponaria]|uniref:GDSL esterase/lipase n=1 Tax=Quillaja saponaria TaxID=32244 RepID=A0AAD7PPF4_QUISA|nr:GDSL esterase/lipase [Quillaja saponaria]